MLDLTQYSPHRIYRPSRLRQLVDSHLHRASSIRLDPDIRDWGQAIRDNNPPGGMPMLNSLCPSWLYHASLWEHSSKMPYLNPVGLRDRA